MLLNYVQSQNLSSFGTVQMSFLGGHKAVISLNNLYPLIISMGRFAVQGAACIGMGDSRVSLTMKRLI